MINLNPADIAGMDRKGRDGGEKNRKYKVKSLWRLAEIL
jgi:hypothetical protein